ncbi:MAG: hypothetical protein M5U26_21315 [Planctomycetota bacterium]|nr:hypothetical protein [Planctomycetota bacterium]
MPILLAMLTLPAFGGEDALYRNDFEQAAEGGAPEEMMPLGGTWKVVVRDGGKALELEPQPLEGHCMLFGPERKGALEVSARALGSRVRRLAPVFGIGLGGVTGFVLKVAPAKDALELWYEEKPAAKVEYKGFKSGAWLRLKLRLVQPDEATWRAEGKVWLDGEPEPAEWPIRHEVKQAPPPGRPALWGAPYAGTPIRFDDLSVLEPKAGEK